MRGHHARRSRAPFGAVIVVLIAMIAVAAVAASRAGSGDGSAVRGGATGAPSGAWAPQRTSASTHDTGTAPSGAPGATTASPTPSPSPEPKGTIVIHGTGDVSLDPSYIPALRSNGYRWAWTGLGGLFRRDDLTVINLECPATRIDAPVPKEFNFRCDPAALPIAARYGVDVANQSNNHAYDQGASGLLDSLGQIRKAGLAPVGAGASMEDALEAAYFDLQGWRVAVVGIDEVLDPITEVAGPDEPGTAAGHDFSLVLHAIRGAARHADIVVVTIHWGVELDTRPRTYQVAEAHRMIDAGADAIFGHHAHRLQPLETYRSRPIFYGLGNFVWPHMSVEGSTTGVAEAIVHPNGRITARLLPAYIVSDGHPVLR
jgi:poly-gamma-glutamate synthesis protein (capsule biosynthesis protein)